MTTRRQLIDRAVIDDLIACIGDDGANAVISLFLDESRVYLATIGEAAVPAADAASRDNARRAAHSLKSGAGQIGANTVAAAAADVERAAAEASPDLALRIAALQQAAAETVAAVKQFLKRD